MANPGILPQDIFTNADLARAGISTKALEEALAVGRVRRVLRGVYAPTDVPDDLASRAQAAVKVVAPGHVFCDRTAAWLHGIDIFGYAEREVLPPIEMCAFRDRWATRADGVRGRSRDLRPTDVMTIETVLITTPLRTALDLACHLHRRDALAALDWFGRQHGITQADLERELPRFRGRRGVVQARSLIPLLDPRAESVRESWLRLALTDAGLPAPVPQYWVDFPDGPAIRLDCAYPAHRIAIEYDGSEFHDSPDQVVHDEQRRSILRELGWTVVVVRNGGFSGIELERWLDEVREALTYRYSNLRW